MEYAHKITVEDARINWADPAETIDRQIRACTPHPELGPNCLQRLIADSGEANEESADLTTAVKPLTLHILAAQPADQTNPNTPIDLDPGELKVGKKNVGLALALAHWNSPRSKLRARKPCALPTGPEAHTFPPPPA